jgi:hypothetical protein
MMLEVFLSIDYLSLQVLINPQTNINFLCESVTIILVLKRSAVLFEAGI